MIADAHAHAWPRWPYPGTGDAGVEALLRALDAAGVERALVVAARLAGVEDDNEYLVAAAERHPDRLDVAVEIDGRWSPDHGVPGAAERLERWIDRPAVVAVALYPHVDDVAWLGGAGAEIVDRASEAGLLVSLAATPAHYALVRGLAARNPRARLLLHHLGLPGRTSLEADLDALAALLATSPGIHVKLSGPWYADAGDPRRVVAAALSRLPPERLVWGSDFPAGERFGATYADAVALVRGLPGLDARALESVLGGAYASLRSSAAS